MGLDIAQRIIKEMMNKPKPGAFALENCRGVEWIDCRDRFANYFTQQVEGFYFSHACDRMQVVSFIEKTEKILNCPIHSLFQSTQRNYATWIFPCQFWRKYFIRRSLLTLLLRVGQQYDVSKDNYEEALYSNQYTKQTKEAIMRFLFGFTEFTVEKWTSGWVATFANKSLEEIRAKLISPKSTESSLIGVRSIWR